MFMINDTLPDGYDFKFDSDVGCNCLSNPDGDIIYEDFWDCSHFDDLLRIIDQQE